MPLVTDCSLPWAWEGPLAWGAKRETQVNTPNLSMGQKHTFLVWKINKGESVQQCITPAIFLPDIVGSPYSSSSSIVQAHQEVDW